MPLAFESLSHGTVPFGFFNIESDMLLLDSTFFFASDFCLCLQRLAAQEGIAPQGLAMEGYKLEGRPEVMGNLMGAIEGWDFQGFIGALYRRFPFPKDPALFRQNPEGYRTRDLVGRMIASWGAPVEVMLHTDPHGQEAFVGPYRFSRSGFQALIRYVWEGGYPRWKHGIRPPYVEALKEALHAGAQGILEGLSLQP